MTNLQLKRGTTAAVNAYIPLAGELVMDTTLNQLRIGNGVLVGGIMIGTVTTDFAASLLAANSAVSALSVLGAAPLAAPAFTGVPTAPTAVAGTNTTQLATTAFVAAGLALKANAASPTLTGTPVAPTPSVGTNTTQIATAGMLQAEFANKRTWTAYTPVISAGSGTFTSVTATGSYMVIFGMCYVRIAVTVTTVGTGAQIVATLPFAALTGTSGMPIPAKESAINGKTGSARILGSLTSVQCTDYNNGDLVTGNGSVVQIMGCYPIA